MWMIVFSIWSVISLGILVITGLIAFIVALRVGNDPKGGPDLVSLVVSMMLRAAPGTLFASMIIAFLRSGHTAPPTVVFGLLALSVAIVLIGIFSANTQDTGQDA